MVQHEMRKDLVMRRPAFRSTWLLSGAVAGSLRKSLEFDDGEPKLNGVCGLGRALALG